MAAWRRLFAQQEEALRAAFDRASSSDAFAESLGAILTTYLDSAQVTRDASSRVLAASDFASKVDIALLSARIDALTNAVDTLSEELRSARLRKGRSH